MKTEVEGKKNPVCCQFASSLYTEVKTEKQINEWQKKLTPKKFREKMKVLLGDVSKGATLIGALQKQRAELRKDLSYINEKIKDPRERSFHTLGRVEKFLTEYGLAKDEFPGLSDAIAFVNSSSVLILTPQELADISEKHKLAVDFVKLEDDVCAIDLQYPNATDFEKMKIAYSLQLIHTKQWWGLLPVEKFKYFEMLRNYLFDKSKGIPTKFDIPNKAGNPRSTEENESLTDACTVVQLLFNGVVNEKYKSCKKVVKALKLKNPDLLPKPPEMWAANPEYPGYSFEAKYLAEWHRKLKKGAKGDDLKFRYDHNLKIAKECHIDGKEVFKRHFGNEIFEKCFPTL